MSDTRPIEYLLTCGARYWSAGPAPLRTLDVPTADRPPTAAVVDVPLPSWAAGIGVGASNSVLVPASSVGGGSGTLDERTDWWGAAFDLLTGGAERAYEEAHGPVHSYAFRLRGFDGRQFDHAWVNRIFLYLRRRAAREAGVDEDRLLGPIPAAKVELTFDLDATAKTPELRLKQGAFHALNAIRLAARGARGPAAGRAAQAWRTATGPGDYDRLDEAAALASAVGVRGTVHVYGGPLPRRGVDRLLDPGYDVQRGPLPARLAALRDAGWEIGVHPGFSAWADAGRMRAARENVEAAVGARVGRARQHWLRFSWCDTWRAQADAGIELDSTLGFNDRPGFRVGAALRFAPWDAAAAGPHRLETLPLVLMDSHLYDYDLVEPDRRSRTIARWLGEIESVRGEAAILWHPHSLDPDYGWRDGFEAALALLRH